MAQTLQKKYLFLTPWVLMLLFGCRFASESNQSSAPNYAIQDIGDIGMPSSMSVASINDKNRIVGNASAPDFKLRGFSWKNNNMMPIAPLKNYDSTSTIGINNHDYSVGIMYNKKNDHDYMSRAYLRTDKRIELLPIVSPEMGSAARDINDQGIIAGLVYKTKQEYRACIWRNGQVVEIGTLGGKTSEANAINNAGVVVGTSTLADGSSRAFVWKNGVMKQLGTLGGRNSQAFDINDQGDIVGQSDLKNGTHHATLWKNQKIIDLGTLGGKKSAASSINNQGQIVGVSESRKLDSRGWGQFSSRLFLYVDKRMYDLNDLIPASANWAIESYFGPSINNKSYIAGTGVRQGMHRGFLLTPKVSGKKTS